MTNPPADIDIVERQATSPDLLSMAAMPAPLPSLAAARSNACGGGGNLRADRRVLAEEVEAWRSYDTLSSASWCTQNDEQAAWAEKKRAVFRHRRERGDGKGEGVERTQSRAGTGRDDS